MAPRAMPVALMADIPVTPMLSAATLRRVGFMGVVKVGFALWKSGGLLTGFRGWSICRLPRRVMLACSPVFTL